MSQHSPYYSTWSAQKDAIELDVQKFNAYSFILKENGIKEVVDLSSLSFHASFGFKPKFITAELKKQLNYSCVTSPKFKTPLKTEVTQALLKFIEKTNTPKGKIFYTVSGAEAVENALRMAQEYTGKNKIISCKKSYHGATLASRQITGDWRSACKSRSLMFDHGYTDKSLIQIENMLTKSNDIAAICLEMIPAINGVYLPTNSWFRALNKLIKKHGVLLILDEVVTGFYRTNKAMGFHHYPALKPDFICMAKTISGGCVPFGAVWTSKKISSFYNKNMLSNGLTNYAHPLGLCALKAVLLFFELDKNKTHFSKLESVLEVYLQKIQKLELVKEVRQIGLMAAIELESNISFDKTIASGLFIVSRGNTYILAPALSMPIITLEKSMKRLLKAIKGGYIYE